MHHHTLEVHTFPIDTLQAFHRNPRRGNTTAIADSLQARGQYRPIVVNIGTHTGRPNEILAGNHTWAAARELGWHTIQATTIDVDDDTATTIVLADNRLADLGHYDDTTLLELLSELPDLTGTGYTNDDLAAMLADLDEPTALTDPDDAPPPATNPVSATGDIWHLGPHILAVGSSTDPDLVNQAFTTAGTQADTIWTDPPYGVDYVGKTANALTIQNDGADGAPQLAADALTTAYPHTRPGAAIYIAHASGPLAVAFHHAIETTGATIRQTLIWVKNTFALGRSDYHYQHEPIYLAYAPNGEGRLGRGGPHWHGDNKQASVFHIDKPTANRDHPTMKPVDLITAMLTNSCKPGGTVYDPFGGSGSTLIAAHHTNRRAILIELDPTYADVILRRYQEHTGTLPELNGEPHDFTA